MGSTFRMPVVVEADVMTAYDRLHAAGVRVLATRTAPERLRTRFHTAINSVVIAAAAGISAPDFNVAQ